MNIWLFVQSVSLGLGRVVSPPPLLIAVEQLKLCCWDLGCEKLGFHCLFAEEHLPELKHSCEVAATVVTWPHYLHLTCFQPGLGVHYRLCWALPALPLACACLCMGIKAI